MTNSKSAFCIIFALLLSISYGQDDDIVEGDTFQKVRLAFNAPSGFYRQLLIGFQPGQCTEGIDPGYDAITNVDLPSDIYFWVNNQPLFIQGVGAFSASSSYPLSVKSNQDGNATISLVTTENMDSNQMVYIHDAENDTYVNLRAGNFVVPVTAGIIHNRFSLRFFQQTTTLGVNEGNVFSKLNVSYLNTDRVILVERGDASTSKADIQLMNMNGQQVAQWTVNLDTHASITVPVSNLSAGTYIISLTTDNGGLVKKFAVR